MNGEKPARSLLTLEKGSGHPVVSTPTKSGVWEQIGRLWSEFQKYISLEVGDGRRIRSLTRCLAGRRKSDEQYPTLYSLTRKKTVYNCRMLDRGGMKTHFRRNFDDWEDDEIGQLLIFLNLRSLMLVSLILSAVCAFSVKILRNLHSICFCIKSRKAALPIHE